MFGSYNLKRTFYAEKKSLIISVLIFFWGFVCGGAYTDFAKDDVFSKSLRASDGYIKSESTFSYGFNDETTLLGLFCGGFFVFGKSIVMFFLFRSGFMLGYFFSFFIKAYQIKGLLSGLVYLFLSLLLCFPWQLLLSSYAFDCCKYSHDTLFKRKNCAVNLKSFYWFFVIFFFLCLIFTLCGNFLRAKLFFEITSKIFS